MPPPPSLIGAGNVQRDLHWLMVCYRTGCLLTCIGHICRAQDKLEESYAFSRRAARVIAAAMSERSFEALTAYYRLAVDEFNRGNLKRAR